MVNPQLRVSKTTKVAQLGRGELRFETRPVFRDVEKTNIILCVEGL